jgi:hypothetical protein
LEALSTFEDAVGAVVSRAGGVQVVPITTGGKRYFDYYIGVERETLLPLLNEVLEPFRYEYKLAFTPDPEKKGYWEEIYPTVDDWRVIRDLAVLEALAGHGDDPDVERSVTHWVYCDAEATAQAYGEWATSEGFQTEEIYAMSESQWAIRFIHRGSMRLSDITHRTIALARKARELGAYYDGWETTVEKRRA